VGRSASCAKSRGALFAKNSNGSKKSKNFIFVSECTDRREQESTARFWCNDLFCRTPASQAGALTWRGTFGNPSVCGTANLLQRSREPLARVDAKRGDHYRVARRPCGRPALSELGVKVSLHPAQALRTPL
jgi:hypothetical protein